MSYYAKQHMSHGMRLQIDTSDCIETKELKQLLKNEGNLIHCEPIIRGDWNDTIYNCFEVIFEKETDSINVWRGYNFKVLEFKGKNQKISEIRVKITDPLAKNCNENGNNTQFLEQLKRLSDFSIGNRVLFDNIPLTVPISVIHAKAEKLGKVISFTMATFRDHQEYIALYQKSFWKQ